MLLKGLWDVLFFYVPALFVLGHDVRRLTWDGGVGGDVKGALAKEVLENCLALQVHLMGDWHCKLEYTRSLSVALLCWQPWMSALPGCCFAEESCEAMIGRMVGRCRQHKELTTFQNLLHLFLTLPVPGLDARPTGGSVRPSLLSLLKGRLTRILHHSDSLPFASLSSSRDGVWKAPFPADLTLPIAPTADDLDRPCSRCCNQLWSPSLHHPN